MRDLPTACCLGAGDQACTRNCPLGPGGRCLPVCLPASSAHCRLPLAAACPLGSDAASETPHALALPLLSQAGLVPIHAELLRFLCVGVGGRGGVGEGVRKTCAVHRAVI